MPPLYYVRLFKALFEPPTPEYSPTLISLINVEVGINVEGGIFWKKLIHNSNKRGVEGGKKSKKSIKVKSGFFLWRVEFFKISKRDFTFIREMRVRKDIFSA